MLRLHVQVLIKNDHRNNPVDTVKTVILRCDLSEVTIPLRFVGEFLVSDLMWCVISSH